MCVHLCQSLHSIIKYNAPMSQQGLKFHRKVNPVNIGGKVIESEMIILKDS